MRSGKLRYPATLVRDVKQKSATGGEVVISTDILTTRVGINYVNSREYIEGGAETMETTVKIVMRTPDSTVARVIVGDEIQTNGLKYTILGVLPFDNGRSLQLMCKEVI